MKSAYEISSEIALTPRRKPARKASALSRSTRADRTEHMDYLSERMKGGLLTLLAEGRVTHEGRVWRGPSGKTVMRETIEALFDRHMVSVVTVTKPKSKHIACLTEIGRLVAERLQIAEAENIARLREGYISEAAQRLIVAMIDDFEDAPTVYASEPEAEVLEP